MLFKRWHQYKLRFVPWLIFNLKNNKSIVVNRKVKHGVQYINADYLIHQIYDLYSKLSQQFTEKFEELIDAKSFQNVNDIVFRHTNFTLTKKTSSIENAGLGVFVASGKITKHAIVAFYPGTVYRPGETVFLQSLGNRFVFRCLDGTLIDGNDRGLSKLVFKSCTRRDRMGAHLINDMTWLTEKSANPLAIGQYVNNACKEAEANVYYEEVDFPVKYLSIAERRFVPNAPFANVGDCDILRTVVLIASREIGENEELQSNYLTMVSE